MSNWDPLFVEEEKVNCTLHMSCLQDSKNVELLAVEREEMPKGYILFESHQHHCVCLYGLGEKEDHPKQKASRATTDVRFGILPSAWEEDGETPNKENMDMYKKVVGDFKKFLELVGKYFSSDKQLSGKCPRPDEWDKILVEAELLDRASHPFKPKDPIQYIQNQM